MSWGCRRSMWLPVVVDDEGREHVGRGIEAAVSRRARRSRKNFFAVRRLASSETQVSFESAVPLVYGWPDAARAHDDLELQRLAGRDGRRLVAQDDDRPRRA